MRHPKQFRKPNVWSDRAQLRRKILLDGNGIHIQRSFQLIEELFVHLNMEVQSFGPPTGIAFVSSSYNSLFETGGFKVLVILLMYSRMLIDKHVLSSMLCYRLCCVIVYVVFTAITFECYSHTVNAMLIKSILAQSTCLISYTLL